MDDRTTETSSDEIREIAQAALAQIDKIKASIEIDREAASSCRADIERLAGEARSLLSQIQPIVAQITAAQTQVVSDQAVIATKSEHIQNAQAHADAVRSNLDKIFTACKQQQTEAEAARTAAQG